MRLEVGLSGRLLGTPAGFFYTASPMSCRLIFLVCPIRTRPLVSRVGRTSSVWATCTGCVVFCGLVGATLSHANPEESTAVAMDTLPSAAEVVVEEESAEVDKAPSSEAEVAYRAAMEAGQKVAASSGSAEPSHCRLAQKMSTPCDGGSMCARIAACINARCGRLFCMDALRARSFLARAD